MGTNLGDEENLEVHEITLMKELTNLQNEVYEYEKKIIVKKWFPEDHLFLLVTRFPKLRGPSKTETTIAMIEAKMVKNLAI